MIQITRQYIFDTWYMIERERDNGIFKLKMLYYYLYQNSIFRLKSQKWLNLILLSRTKLNHFDFFFCIACFSQNINLCDSIFYFIRWSNGVKIDIFIFPNVELATNLVSREIISLYFASRLTHNDVLALTLLCAMTGPIINSVITNSVINYIFLLTKVSYAFRRDAQQ